VTTVTLKGIDGSVWNLNDVTSAALLVGGLGGLHLPPATNRWTTTARRSGRRWKDVVNDARKFTMTVRVGDPAPPFRTGDDWRALDSLFWKALSTESLATLTVGSRSLPFRLDDDNESEFPKDPALLGKAVYSIACIADKPEWLGATQTATYTFAADSTTSYYGASQGPPFTISAPTFGRTASISNPGDLASYPVYRIVGPAASAVVGVGNDLITLPFALQAGQQVVIDTEAQTIVDGTGTNLWPQMGSAAVAFAPVPAGGQVPIHVGLSSATTASFITVTLVPRYRRAW